MAMSKFVNFVREHKDPIIGGLTSASVATALHYALRNKDNNPSKIVVMAPNQQSYKTLSKIIKNQGGNVK